MIIIKCYKEEFDWKNPDFWDHNYTQKGFFLQTRKSHKSYQQVFRQIPKMRKLLDVVKYYHCKLIKTIIECQNNAIIHVKIPYNSM